MADRPAHPPRARRGRCVQWAVRRARSGAQATPGRVSETSRTRAQPERGVPEATPLRWLREALPGGQAQSSSNGLRIESHFAHHQAVGCGRPHHRAMSRQGRVRGSTRTGACRRLAARPGQLQLSVSAPPARPLASRRVAGRRCWLAPRIGSRRPRRRKQTPRNQSGPRPWSSSALRQSSLPRGRNPAGVARADRRRSATRHRAARHLAGHLTSRSPHACRAGPATTSRCRWSPPTSRTSTTEPSPCAARALSRLAGLHFPV